MKIGQFSREIWPFFWLNVTFQDLFTEISLACLIIVRCSIRNHRWKAKNLLYHFQLPEPVLHSRSAPLNGRLRYHERLLQAKDLVHFQYQSAPRKSISRSCGITVLILKIQCYMHPILIIM